MAIPVKFSDEVQAHIDAGHFTIYSKAWMRNKRIWFWTKGTTEIIGGGCVTKEEAATAATEWYASQ